MFAQYALSVLLISDYISLQRVAEAAGVAVSTVSRVLSGRGNLCRITPETQRRIQLVAQQLGYRRAANMGIICCPSVYAPVSTAIANQRPVFVLRQGAGVAMMKALSLSSNVTPVEVEPVSTPAFVPPPVVSPPPMTEPSPSPVMPPSEPPPVLPPSITPDPLTEPPHRG